MVDDPTPVAGARPAPDVNATTEPGRVRDASLATSNSADAPTLVPASNAAAATVTLPPPGYELGAPIGRGGMGEVLVAHDLRIGREVAVKRMNAKHPSSEQTTRFLREARIQARLEHPAIVPVHELGVDDKGRLYFTMKRLIGKTLGARVAEGYPLTRTLRALSEVCLAVEFAHVRGVIHRDLKPANIMLGEYGEVYVIDWGIARVSEDESANKIAEDDIAMLDDGTNTGALLGTPGYMAPEQLRGTRTTGAADVYALGAILFELLAGEQLHKRGEQGIASTLNAPQVSPATRRPDRAIPPELDALCFAALAEDAAQRPTARELGERITRYLEGDRDLEKRRALACASLTRAEQALGGADRNARAVAMRHAGRALALDPESEPAAQMVSALLLSPPDVLPEDCARGLREFEEEHARARARTGLWTYASLFLLLPATFFLNIGNWTLVLGFYGVLAIAMAQAYRSTRTGRPRAAAVLLVNLAVVILFSRLGGPFVLTPLFICGSLIGTIAIPWINERRWVVASWAFAAVVAPIILELSPNLTTTTFHEGGMRIRSNVIHSTGASTAVALIGASVILTVAFGLFVLAITRRRREAQRQLFVQAWHLRQLLPNHANPASVPR